MNSKKNGDLFEYMFCAALNSRGITCIKGESTVKKWASTFKIDESCVSNIDTFLSGLNKINSYELTSHTDGKNGVSSDVRLNMEEKQSVGISLKKNNISIKAQRPSSLHKQMGLQISDQYKMNYKTLESQVWNEIKNKTRYNEIEPGKKSEILKRFNDLYYNRIKNATYLEQSKFITFLLGDSDYIIKWEKNGNISVFKTFNEMVLVSIINITKTGNYIFMDLSNGIKLKLRLHTASSCIKKNLSLKYDTTFCNIIEYHENG
jgi:hypothetical protein